jgi:hypothetical protein
MIDLFGEVIYLHSGDYVVTTVIDLSSRSLWFDDSQFNLVTEPFQTRNLLTEPPIKYLYVKHQI